EAQRRSLMAVHAQKGVAHCVSVGVPNRDVQTTRCVSRNTIERESTRVVTHIAYVQSTGARRAALDHCASLYEVGRHGLRLIRRCALRRSYVRSETKTLINFMFGRALRVEAATEERPRERERLRGIKRNDSIIRSAWSNGAIREHSGRSVQSHRSAIPTG